MNDFEGNESSEEVIQRHNEQCNSKLYDSIQRTQEEVKSKAREIKSIFCKSCGLNGLEPECETTRTNALNLKKVHFPLIQQFKVECDRLRSNPRELFEFFSSIYPENYSLRYCIFHYVFSDYAFLSEIDWELSTYSKLAQSFRHYVEEYTSQLPEVDHSLKAGTDEKTSSQKSEELFCDSCEFAKNSKKCVKVYLKVKTLMSKNVKKKRYLLEKYYDLQNNIAAYYHSLVNDQLLEPSEVMCYTKKLLFEIKKAKDLSLSVNDEQIIHELAKNIQFSKIETKIELQRPEKAYQEEEKEIYCKLCERMICEKVERRVSQFLTSLSDEEREEYKEFHKGAQEPNDFFARALRVKTLPKEFYVSDEYLFCYFVQVIKLIDIEFDENTLVTKIWNFLEFLKGE